ncbi:MAG: CBS domain-containing protein [Aigarchaeota archaeon]|nr:CBS domain-containing protein [Aigarchaeota archaeon]MDW8021877.1 CBS domain-containing protein [Nitrososphaerota archaeon]
MPPVWDLKSLARIRRRLGLTQAELARLSGVSQSLISKIEGGKIDPSYEAVKRIFDALELVEAERGRGLTAGDICTREVITINVSDQLGRAIDLMKRHGISQLPVLDRGRVIGTISESTIVRKLEKIRSTEIRVGEIMDEALPTIPETASLTLLRDLFQEYPAVLVQKNGEVTGIVTRADLFKVLDSKIEEV